MVEDMSVTFNYFIWLHFILTFSHQVIYEPLVNDGQTINKSFYIHV